MNKILFTEEFCQPENLFPFTLTRQIQDIRIGILTIREKWEAMLNLPSFDRKEDDYKDLNRSMSIEDAVADAPCLMIHGNILPTPDLITAAKNLAPGDALCLDNTAIIFCISRAEVQQPHAIRIRNEVPFSAPVKTIRYPWEIFQLNDWAIRQDFAFLTQRRHSQPIPSSNRTTSPENIFLEEGVIIENCILNASTGPIYIGKNAEVMEGCIIRGPLALNEGACLKLGTKVYGATTLGPRCVVGGEIKNSILFGYSNKAHDGYLGDSVIGEWCNLGAGTTNSNLKNNAGDVRVWTSHGQMVAGNKCGVMMGDYSRTSINTAINTGTVIGVCANVFGAGLTPAHIPNFSWGSEGIRRYDLEKSFEHIDNWKKLKGQALTSNEKTILNYIFAHH